MLCFQIQKQQQLNEIPQLHTPEKAPVLKIIRLPYLISELFRHDYSIINMYNMHTFNVIVTN